MPIANIPKKQTADLTLDFTATLFTIGTWTILLLPKAESAKLPSRGQAMVEGTFNDVPIQTPLEPDGNWNHWFRVEEPLLKSARVKAGDKVSMRVTIIPNRQWPEPEIPSDMQKAIAADDTARALWSQITPMAHWEWVRWIRSTGRQETRNHRIAVAISKMNAGERRPCCWNRNLSTEPTVSKNGVLLVPQPETN